MYLYAVSGQASFPEQREDQNAGKRSRLFYPASVELMGPRVPAFVDHRGNTQSLYFAENVSQSVTHSFSTPLIHLEAFSSTNLGLYRFLFLPL